MNILQCSNGDGPTRAERRRSHLLDTARGLFIQRGFHGTGVAQLAEASGVKVGQIYRDFASKEEIIAAIALRDLSAFLDESELERAIAQKDLPAIRHWILAFVAHDGDFEGYRLMPEIAAEAARSPRIAKLQEEITGRVRTALHKALAACAPGPAHAAARAETADLIITLGVGLCQWIVMEWQRGRDPACLCARLRAIVERELDTLCAPDAMPA